MLTYSTTPPPRFGARLLLALGIDALISFSAHHYKQPLRMVLDIGILLWCLALDFFARQANTNSGMVFTIRSRDIWVGLLAAVVTTSSAGVIASSRSQGCNPGKNSVLVCG